MSIIASEIKYHSNMLEPYPWLDYHQQYDFILIIPASNEPDLLTTIASLEDCHYDTDYAVVLLINESEQCTGEQSRVNRQSYDCLLYTSPSPRDATLSRMPSSA